MPCWRAVYQKSLKMSHIALLLREVLLAGDLEEEDRDEEEPESAPAPAVSRALHLTS